jgi:hypothetical protein
MMVMVGQGVKMAVMEDGDGGGDGEGWIAVAATANWGWLSHPNPASS